MKRPAAPRRPRATIDTAIDAADPDDPADPTGDAEPRAAYRRAGFALTAALLLLIGTALYLVADKRRDIWDTAHDSALSVALGLEAATSAVVSQSVASLTGLREDLAAHPGADRRAALANAMRFDPVSEVLGIAGRGGRWAVGKDRLPVPPSLLDEAQAGLAEGAGALLWLHPPMRLPNKDGWFVPLTLVLDAQTTAFALIPAHRLADAAATLGTLGRDGHIAFARIDGARLLRFYPRTGALRVNGPAVPASAMALTFRTPTGTTEAVSSLDGGSHVIGYVRSATLPWFVAALVPTDSLTRKWLAESAGPLLAVALGLAGMALFGARLRGALRTNRAHVARLRYLGEHDSLTGVLNRDAFVRRVQAAIDAGAHRRFAVVVLDISGFKDINDTLGHAVGDEVLRVVAARMRELLGDGSGAAFARLGGDAFGVFAPVAGDPAHALDALRERLRSCLGRTVAVSGVELELAAVNGAALYPADADSAAELLRCADIAVSAGKADLRPFTRYAAGMDKFTPEMLALKSELAKALRDGGLAVAYQPKIRLADGAVVGVEALARWNHLTRGPVSPAEFVPLAESSELIHPFTQHILEAALRQARDWLGAGHFIPVSVNISANNLLEPAFADKVAALLRELDVPAALLELELTESAVMRHPDTTIKRLHALRELGVALAIDDFGTGYASMTYLKHLPVQSLKLDRSFVSNLHSDVADQRIVRSAIQLAHEFGMSVVAEGVECEQVARILTGYACDSAQGYYYERPMGGDQLLDRCRRAGAIVAGAADAGAPVPRAP